MLQIETSVKQIVIDKSQQEQDYFFLFIVATLTDLCINNMNEKMKSSQLLVVFL